MFCRMVPLVDTEKERQPARVAAAPVAQEVRCECSVTCLAGSV